MDSHKEVSPEEIKSREMVLGYRESWTSFASVVSQRRSYGHGLCDSVLSLIGLLASVDVKQQSHSVFIVHCNSELDILVI